MRRDQVESAQLRGETPRAKKAFLDYVTLGESRSVQKLHDRYRDPEQFSQTGGPTKPPTRQLNTLKLWCAAYNWTSRVNHLTDHQVTAVLEEQKRNLATILRHRYAKVDSRVETLNEIAEMLVKRIQKTGGITLIVKQVGYGTATKMVEEEQTDVLTINALRGILADIATEVGGRTKKVSHEFPDGVPGDRSIFLLPPVAGAAEALQSGKLLSDTVLDGEFKTVPDINP